MLSSMLRRARLLSPDATAAVAAGAVCTAGLRTEPARQGQAATFRKKPRKRRRLDPLEALDSADSLTDYRRLRGFPENMPIPFFPELRLTNSNSTLQTRMAFIGLEEKLRALEASEAHAHPPDPQWRLDVAVCFERYPRLTRDATDAEKDWDEFATKIHEEKSALLKVERDRAAAVAKAEERRLAGESDFEDSSKKFAPAPRETEADRTNDRTSLDRRLQDKLYFVRKAVGASDWTMPRTTVQGSETLREAAERCLADVVVEPTEIYFVSNAPSYCQTIEFDSNKGGQADDGQQGVKVFYYRALLVTRSASLDHATTADFKWLAKDELAEQFPDAHAEAAAILL